MKFWLITLSLFCLSALISRTITSPQVESKKIILTTECEALDPKSSFADKQEVKACRIDTIQTFEKAETFYPKKVLDEVSRYNKKIQKYLKKTPETEKELEVEFERVEDLKATTESFKRYYPRFKIADTSPDDYLNFGIHTGDYLNATDFLGKRACDNPSLYYANFMTAYLSLFFSINNGRDYGGIVRIINEKFVTPIESSLRFSKDDYYFSNQRAPTAEFSSWVHEDIERDYSGFHYQDQPIVQVKWGWESTLFMSPWLYNACNKSISAIQNFCSLDPGYDMELKDFFYLTKFDLILGNIYCRKSNDPNWTRIATFEQIRI